MRFSFSSVSILLAASVQAQSGTVDPSTIKDCTFFTDYPSTSNPGQGTTCDSIASYWGITKAQFITYNPSVGSDCSKLKQGYSYCVEENNGNGPPVTTTITSGSPTNTGAPSPTQTGLTKDCTQFYLVQNGDYCQGIVDKYGTFTLNQFYSWNPAVGSSCGGLQSGYYVCVGLASTPTKSPVTATATSGPEPEQTGITKDCQKYYKVVSGDQCQAIVDKFGTFTLNQFYSWNPAVGSDCTKLFVGYYVCVGVTGTPTSKPTSTKPTGPSPTQTGIRKDCTKFYKAVSGDSCDSIQAKFKTFTVAQFESWNPAVGSTCTKLIAGDYYCIAVPGTPTTPIKTATPTPTGKGPQPQQSGIVSNCNRYHKVVSGDTCAKIESGAGISSSQFLNWNKGIKSDCSNLFLGYYVCTGVA